MATQYKRTKKNRIYYSKDSDDEQGALYTVEHN